MEFIAVLYIAVIVILVLFILWKIVTLILELFFSEFFNRYLLILGLDARCKNVLQKEFPYYMRLPDDKKRHFEKRVRKFIQQKRFISRSSDLKVTPEMKTLIAASAVQLTFGYPGVYFEHFDKILIYPEDYYSRITRKYHLGEVNLQGIIVLSWKNFKAGYANTSDGHNLGLHEMAHALRLENLIRNAEFDFIDAGIMKEFDQEARNEMERMKLGKSKFMGNAYAGSDLQEFFSIAVENFFERPQVLHEKNERIYSLLTLLLKQDPLQKLV